MRSNKEYQEPNERLLSDGDILIKQLVQKQLNNKTDLKTELFREKQFTNSSSELISITSYACGAYNLDKFKECSDYIHNLEELKSYGLNDDEIDLFIDYKRNDDIVPEKYKRVCDNVLQAKLNRILDIVKKQQLRRTSDNGDNNLISRHSKEIALCVKPESEETKLYNFALSCTKTNQSFGESSKSDSIDLLPEISKKLFHSENKSLSTMPCLKKRRKRARRFLDNKDNTETSKIKCVATDHVNGGSKWDVKESQDEHHNKNIKKNLEYTCSPCPQLYTIRNNQIVKLNSLENDTDSNQIKSNKIYNGKAFINCNSDNPSEEILINREENMNIVDKIRQIPRFESYQKGEPSKTLFIKNLAKNVAEQDLVEIFNQFESCHSNKDKIVYRLLNGRMQGQAFITFANINTATSALETVNGRELKGKPIIIQYGHGKK